VITLRKSDDRGHLDHGWLDARHTFSFGRYVDRAHMGFGPLRVINEDRVAPGAGFATHPHDNMEIITYVLSGALRHDDSTGGGGGGGVLKHHDIQAMTAGSGLTHSEKNASTTEPLHLLQVWIEPAVRDVPPAYADKRFDPAPAQNALQPLASPDGRDGSLTINQDAVLSRVFLDPAKTIEITVPPGRRLWIHAAQGEGDFAGDPLAAGDAASTETPGGYALTGGDTGLEALVFDLP